MRLKLLLLCILISSGMMAQKNGYMAFMRTSPDHKYKFTEVYGDPAKARVYKLNNGLTVILAENHLEPQIMALFAVKAGSKNDPADHTGLAHYLEHMLFKGTDKFGTMDYAKEKVELDKIDGLYELYGQTTDENSRKSIYHRIDSISNVASRYAIANEYDKMMADVGSRMTNAFTSFENTTYMENFPSNNLEKFLKIQKERFRNPVLRLFHTELEAVYEEKNISLDNGDNKIFEAMFGSLFKNHPYGTQTTIGTIEHLKNPSLKEIRKYYQQNYVAGNMAIILAGDLDPDETIALVDKYFGDMPAKNAPIFTFQAESPIDSVTNITLYTPDEEKVAIGYRMPSALDSNAVVANLISAILYNGKSGLIDQNLVNNQKVLEGYAFTYLLKDHGVCWLQGRPKDGQTLDQVKDLFLEQISKLKRGDFDTSLISGTVNNMKLALIQQTEKASNTAFLLHESFVIGRPWVDYLNDMNAMAKVSKEDIMRFAATYFQNNYTVIYKKTGSNEVAKVVKPEIHPVELNRDAQSDFLKSMMAMTTTPIQPKFLDFDKDVVKSTLVKGVPIWYVPNTINQLFNLYYKFDFGSTSNPKLQLAMDYLQYIGTTTKSNSDINKQLYNLGLNWGVQVGEEEMYFYLSGLEENFDKGVAILEDLINNPKADKAVLTTMVDNLLKSRQDNLINKDVMMSGGLQNYLKYGAKNPFNTILTNDQLKKITAEELIALIKSSTSIEHKVMYCGARPLDQLNASLRKAHKLPKVLAKTPMGKPFNPLITSENAVYFVNYDMVQANINFKSTEEVYNPALETVARAFNEYYGGGMASVVFQDIRESRALAYSAYSNISIPAKKDKNFVATFYVGTQADKFNDAMGAIRNLLDNMPVLEKSWDLSKNAILSEIQTQRINKSGILFSYENALNKGLNYDIRKDIYNNIQKMSLSDVQKFHADHFKNQKWNIGIMGSSDKIKMDDLKKYGTVKVLSLKDLYGYDESDFKPVKP